MGPEDVLPTEQAPFDTGRVFAALRSAAGSLTSDEWGAVCIDALARAAGASGGLILDAGGVVVGIAGLDESEAYELATIALGPESDVAGSTAVLYRRSLTLVCIPLRVDGRSAGVAVLAGENESFASRAQQLEGELHALASALLRNAPWVAGRHTRDEDS